MTSYKIQPELRFELMENEIPLWTGNPSKQIVFRSSDIFYIPFSLAWFSVFLFFFVEQYNHDKWAFFTFWFFVFMIAGLHFVVGRFFYERKRRANMLYCITDKRVIILSGIWLADYESVYVDQLPAQFTINERPDGSGTIIFGPNNFRLGMLPGIGKLDVGYTRAPRLEMINDVKYVQSLLLKLQKN
ncbi:hypothetical protein ACPPVU_08660 [Mucilaginibacter sp. McL0603]|uniref:hypothetical protein n=1 Tax=Mucilaginibacter sp. McL0603 TaxID=3415670 RepID=UPI003CEA3D08